MAQHRHLFVIDPIENLNLKLDSSLRLANALLALGHECFCSTINDFSWQSVRGEATITVKTRQLLGTTDATPEIGEEQIVPGDSLDAVHMRKDPPFNLEYLSCTWTLSELGRFARVYNAPQALRDKNEKLIILDYPDFIQPALVSSQVPRIIEFSKSYCQGDIIVKPLDLFGGRGVERINFNASTEDLGYQKLMQLTHNEQQVHIIQPFNQAIHQGEVRVFTAGGQVLSWCLKVPAEGEFLANTRMGAQVLDYQPSREEESMVVKVSKDLLKQGIFMVGYDLIGGCISEINITSPRLLLPPTIDSKPYYQRLAEIISKDLA